MLIIEIAVGVFLGGMGLWMFVSYREKKKQADAKEVQAFSATERFVASRVETLSAEWRDDFRARLATIFDDSSRSPIEVASSEWKRFERTLQDGKSRLSREAREALKDSFAAAENAGTLEKLSSHCERLIEASLRSVTDQMMLMYVNELQSLNDDDLPSVTKGHPRKLFNLGNGHRLGKNVERDLAKAERLLTLSADQGYADAQAILGHMYYQGEGVEQNYQEAHKWLSLAAAKGDAYAQNILGLMYSRGEGVELEQEQAFKWCLLSAAQRFPAALLNLGVMYHKGEGIGRDHVVARMLFNLAAAHGESSAQFNLDVMNDVLTPVQIAEMDKVAKEREATFFATLDGGNDLMAKP